MKISDVSCAHCGALYMLAESVSVDSSRHDGSVGDAACSICSKTLESDGTGGLRVFRLVMSPPAQRPPRKPLSPTISP